MASYLNCTVDRLLLGECVIESVESEGFTKVRYVYYCFILFNIILTLT